MPRLHLQPLPLHLAPYYCPEVGLARPLLMWEAYGLKNAALRLMKVSRPRSIQPGEGAGWLKRTSLQMGCRVGKDWHYVASPASTDAFQARGPVSLSEVFAALTHS